MADRIYNHPPLARLLIADDDAVLRMTLGKLYTRAGYAVALANDGKEALEYLAGQAFDMALIDLNMPGMNGVETLKALKKCAPDLPVVIFTAVEDRQAYDEAVSCGVTRFLTKPLRRENLLDLVREIILSNKPHKDSP